MSQDSEAEMTGRRTVGSRRPARAWLGRRVLALLSAALIAVSVTTAGQAVAAVPAPSAPAPKTSLGLNVGGLAYWQNTIPFTDRFKTTGEWLSTDDTFGWDTGRGARIPRDADGYPLQLPLTLDGVSTWVHAIVMDNVHPAGDYVLRYDGTGTLRPEVAGAVEATKGRITFRLTANQPLVVTLSQSSAADHVRNVRLVRAADEAVLGTRLFDPQFVASLRGMKVLRFMDWNVTPTNPVRTWAEQVTPTSYSQGTERGVALEYQIALANQLGADLWLNIPVWAQDSYVTGAARMVKSRLKAGLKVYVELGNEIWNGGYWQQQNLAADSGCAAGLNAIGDYTGACTDGGVRFWAAMKWQARRSGQVFKTFSTVLADPNRLVKLVASQAANADTGRVLLASLADPTINPSRQRADALAIAPYLTEIFTPDDQAAADALTVDSAIARLRAEIPTSMRTWVSENSAVATAAGVELVTYEAGQHAVGVYGMENDDHLTSVLTAANRDPRMRSVYAQMFAEWQRHDVDVMVLFTHIGAYSKWGSWGVLEYQGQPASTAPKYLAIKDFLAAHP